MKEIKTKNDLKMEISKIVEEFYKNTGVTISGMDIEVTQHFATKTPPEFIKVLSIDFKMS